ncbi:MAG: head-tail connector protein [Rhodospirillaceae bacterium]
MPLTQVSGPATLPVTLAEACAHLRIAVGEDDAFITDLISAATSHLDGEEGVLQRCLVQQSWTYTRDDLPSQGFQVPLVPASITSVSYVDSGGVTTVLAADQYTLSGDWIYPAHSGITWPVPRSQADAVSVTFQAGFGAVEDVPQALKQAILLLIGLWYDQRAAVTTGEIGTVLPLGVDALITPFKRSYGA